MSPPSTCYKLYIDEPTKNCVPQQIIFKIFLIITAINFCMENLFSVYFMETNLIL